MSESVGLGALVVTLMANTLPLGQAEKQLYGFVGRTNTLMGTLKRTVGMVFAGISAYKLAKGFLDAAVAVENYKVSLNAIMKDAQKTEAVFQELNEWAAINPIDTSDAVAAFVRLKTAAVVNAREGVQAAADLATVMGTSAEYVANAMVSTNNKMLRNIGIQLDRTGKTAIVRSGQVRLSVSKDIDSIRRAIIEVIQKNFAGAMDAAANTWRGSINTMRGLWVVFEQEVMGTATSGGPFGLLESEIIKVRDAWIDWMQGSGQRDYLEFVSNFQRVIRGSINGVVLVIEGLVNIVGFLIEHLDLLKNAFIVLAGTKGIMLVVKAMTYLNVEFAAGMALLPTATSLISKFGVAFMELRTATTVIGGLKGALAALGLSAGGVTALAIGGLILLADSFQDIFGDAYERIRSFNRELRDVPMEVLQKVVDASNTLGINAVGGKGMQGWRESVEIATRREIKQQEELAKLQEGKLRAMELRIKEKGYGPRKYDKNLIEDDSGIVSMESKYTDMVNSIKDQIKYLYANGKDFLPILDAWMAKMKPLSAEWKAVKDLSIDIKNNMAKLAGEDVVAGLKRIEKQKELQNEAKEAAVAGVDKFWSRMEQGYVQGLISGKMYFSMLEKEFTNLQSELNSGLDSTDMANWSEETLDRFSKTQAMAQALAEVDMDNLFRQFDQGNMATSEWTAQVEALIAQYAKFPLVVKWLQSQITGTKNALDMVKFSSREWLAELSSGLANAIVQGNSLLDVLQNLARQLASMFLNNLFSKLFANIFKLNAKGNVYSNGEFVPFSKGGVVSSPSVFPFSRGIGLMAEKGPEAIMPLKRDSQGALGVSAIDGAGAGNIDSKTVNNITMNVNIQATDAPSFVKLLRSNKSAVESLMVENIMRTGSVRNALKGVV